MKSPQEQLAQLTKYINDLLKRERELKSQYEQVAKERTMLGIKPVEAITQDQLPIVAAVIEQVQTALKEKGLNVKSLQKALGIFDYAEMTRKRKALIAAGVTKETENHNGTNATFVELIVEAPAEPAPEAAK
jgi:archaellum component FlaC